MKRNRFIAWSSTAKSVNRDLEAKAQALAGIGHHTIYPTRRMHFDEFVGLIKGMNWKNIEGESDG